MNIRPGIIAQTTVIKRDSVVDQEALAGAARNAGEFTYQTAVSESNRNPLDYGNPKPFTPFSSHNSDVFPANNASASVSANPSTVDDVSDTNIGDSGIEQSNPRKEFGTHLSSSVEALPGKAATKSPSVVAPNHQTVSMASTVLATNNIANATVGQNAGKPGAYDTTGPLSNRPIEPGGQRQANTSYLPNSTSIPPKSSVELDSNHNDGSAFAPDFGGEADDLNNLEPVQASFASESEFLESSKQFDELLPAISRYFDVAV